MVRVRPGSIDDLDAVLDMGRAMHQESPRYARASFSEEKVRNLAVAILSGAMPGCAAFIAEDDGDVIGMFVGMVTEQWFSTDKSATDLVFYVKPEFRGRSLAPWRLVHLFEKWAVAQGVRSISCGSSTGVNAARTADLYRRLGYQEYAIGLVKHVEPGAHGDGGQP